MLIRWLTFSAEKRKNLSIEDKKVIIDRIDAGETPESVAADVGVPAGFVQYIYGNKDQVIREHQFKASSSSSSSKRLRTCKLIQYDSNALLLIAYYVFVAIATLIGKA